MLRHPPEGPLQHANEGQRERLAGLHRLVSNDLVDVVLCRLACGWRTRRWSVSK
jgi:hypothetical protein